MTTKAALDRKEAFRRLAEDQLPRLYSIARRLVGDDAEDAVQDALERGFKKLDQLESDEAAASWLIQILVNICRDRGRSRARHPEEIRFEAVEGFSLYRKIANEDPFPYSDSLHLDFLHQFGREDVQEVLTHMPDIYRIPLALVHMDGFATKEVAKILDAPLGTVLARLHRGRKLFEKSMWDYAAANDLLKEKEKG